MTPDSSRKLAIEAIQDPNYLRKEYNAAVVEHVNAIMLVEVLISGHPEVMSVWQLAVKGSETLGSCTHFPTRVCTEPVIDVFDRLKLGNTCDFDPSITASTVISLLFDNVKLDTLLYAADSGARIIVQRAAELFDLSDREVRRGSVSEMEKLTVKKLHELWDNNAASLFDAPHGAADDGLDDYRPYDIDLASLPRPSRQADRDPPLPTSMCEPSERECAALTWTLRVGVADQYWRYVHDVLYGHICVAVETPSVSKGTFINKLSGPFVQRRREQQKHKLHSKLSSTNIPHALKSDQHRDIVHIGNNSSAIAECTLSRSFTTASTFNGPKESSIVVARRSCRQNPAMATMGVSKSIAIVPICSYSLAMAVPSRGFLIGSLFDLATVEDEYNATVDSHVHAVVLTEVLGLLGDYMIDICKAYEESEMLLAERLTSLHTRHVELGGQPLSLPTSTYPVDPRARVLSKASLKSAARTFRSQLPTLQTSAELAFPASSNVTSSTGADPNTDSGPTDDSALIRFALPDATKLQLLLAAADDIVLGSLRRAYRLYDRMGKETKKQLSAYVDRLINVRLALEDRLRQLDQRVNSTLAVPTGMCASSSSATLGVTIGSAEAFNPSHSHDHSLEHLGSNDPGDEGPRPPLASDEDDTIDWILKLRLADEYWRFAQGVNEALKALYTRELGVSSEAHKRHKHNHKSKRGKSKTSKVSKDVTEKPTAHASSKPAKATTSSKPAKHTTKRSLIDKIYLPFFQRKRRHGSVALGCAQGAESGAMA
ncbi:hypothetical protein K523DRAFT_398006 [Schizophyllum commune Tattone D]|nr:hypothetical protein K523DRAFT_398006 [Schizophyllum commune Tattone D]